jgi:Ca2+-binding RTX toxin-like protein
MRARRLAPLFAVAVSLTVAVGPASAGSLYTTGSGKSKTLHFDAAPGETNNVSMSFAVQNNTEVVWVSDWAPIAVGTGCQEVAGSVYCTLAPLIAIDIKLGDGNDGAAASLALPTNIAGEAGDDGISAGPAADNLDGGSGDDQLSGGGGADVLTGGDGTDRADFFSSAGQSISLDDLPNDGTAGQDANVHSDVEALGGGDGPDTMTGTDANETFIGRDGDDVIDGGGGDDMLEGDGGGDTLHGGAGNDTLTGVYGFGGGDCATDHLYGDAGNDSVTVSGTDSSGDGGPDDDVLRPYNVCTGVALNGGDGIDVADFGYQGAGFVTLDDVANDGVSGPGTTNVHTDIENLQGGGGPDVLIGDAGANSVDGGPGDDILDGAGGADTLTGGDGSDVVDYSSRTSPVHVDLDGETGDDGEAGEGDSVGSDVEGIWGGSANDVLAGGPGDDSIDGGPGADQISGGPGDDTADYSLRSAAVTADTSGSAGDDGEAGEGDSIAADVEDLVGGAGNDTLSGNAAANYIWGGPGNDVLAGGDGNDSLAGDDGNDSLDGGAGIDDFSADAGDDTVLMQDTVAEFAVCGDGNDSVTADRTDVVDSDCEQVSLPPLPPKTSTTRLPRTPIVRTTPLPPPPPALAVADTTAPRGSLLLKPVTLRRALRIGQRVVVSCDTTCSSRIELELSAKAARRLGMKNVKGPVVVATGVRATVNSTHYVVVIRFAKKLRAKLAKAPRLSLRLHAVFADSAGNRRPILRKLALR